VPIPSLHPNTGEFNLIALFVWLLFGCAPAQAQSVTTYSGMQPYNRGEISKAYELLRRAADSGDAEAQVNLGYLYARGQGVMVDQLEALRLYRRAAAQGSSEGMNAIGYKYQFGTGIPINMNLAVEWYCRAVAFGNPRGINNLANMLFAGRDVPRDIADARSLWEQAAALGHNNAMYNMAVSYYEGPDGERDAAKANEWLLSAAEAGNPKAQTALRRRGYAGVLPPQIDEATMMIPSPSTASGHAKICGALIS
jgi:uncharacterized protein